MDDFEYSLYISDQDWEMFYRECEGCNLLCPGLTSREDSGVSDVDEMVHHSINLPPPPGAASTEADANLQIDGPPVDSYLSEYGVCGPEQLLSGSEEDLHLQTVNLFFEQLKGVVELKQPLEESHAAERLEGLNVNQVIQSVDVPPPGRNEANLKEEPAKQGELDTWSCPALGEAAEPTSTNTQINASDSTERELEETGGEQVLLQKVTEGIKPKQESCCDLSTELKLNPETQLPERTTQVVRGMPDSNPEKENKTQLETGSSSQIRQTSPSNLRRKRRKKRRVCNESRDTGHGYEAQLRVCHSESEEERFTPREEMNCQTTYVRKTEDPLTSSTPHHSPHLLSGCSLESTGGLKYSKSLPESLTAFEVRHASINNVSRSMSEMFLLNRGAENTELCQLSTLPPMRKVLNSQESGIGSIITECDSVTQLEDTDSRTCCEQNMASKIIMRRNSDTESDSDGNSLTAFEHVDVTKSQTFEVSTYSPLMTNSQCHKTENTVLSAHEEEDSHIQNLNKSCEEFIVNNSQIKSGNCTDDVDSGNEDGDSCSAAVLCDRTSSENITSHEAEDAVAVLLEDQNPSPVFAVSSFWNEMEKLTISDMRLQRISVLTRPEDGVVIDTNDAADSDYFTQSKPDRSSGDMSLISDLDEDLSQLPSQSSLQQEDETSEFPSRACCVAWENDSDPTITGDNMMLFGSESSPPKHLNTANAQQGVGLQDLQAVEAPPVRPMKRKTSPHSIHPEAEDLFYHINTSCSACSSDDEEIESSGVTFSEILQYFFGGEEPCISRADSDAASVPDETGTCVPEMYDHFFSEYESGSFFSLFEDESGGNKDKIVPIFSCSRSTNRPLQFPEAYDYFFPDSPVHSDEDDENDTSPITVVTWYDHESPNHCPVSAVDMYEHFYPEDTFQDNVLWENPFSFRRAAHADPAVSEDELCSWAVTPVKPHTGLQAVTVMGPDDSPVSETFYLSLEKHIFQQLSEQQKKCLEIQTVVADPRLDAALLPLGQADMCLICIAFASWVLKSASPGADAWKAALLANVSALSAIRYLRRHKRDVSGKAPLLQIESV